jgi:Holliday junction resolvase-like predicted endonuclease
VPNWTEDHLKEVNERIALGRAKAKKRKQPEAILKKGIRRALELKGWFVVSIVQGFGSQNGMTDFICMKAGRVVFAEIKTDKGRQSDFQKAFEINVARSGCEYKILRTVEEALSL